MDLSSTPPPEPEALKRAIRRQALANRQAQVDKDRLSEIICRSLAELAEYRAAHTVLFYVDARAEVRTRPFLSEALVSGKSIVVPYCQEDRLQLFRLESMGELASGSFQILEPRVELRELPERRVEIGQIELAIVPGVAFDTCGGRLGHGLGYYDKLLATARGQTWLVALAFECQLFPRLPSEEHDVAMDIVITERSVYRTAH